MWLVNGVKATERCSQTDAVLGTAARVHLCPVPAAAGGSRQPVYRKMPMHCGHLGTQTGSQHCCAASSPQETWQLRRSRPRPPPVPQERRSGTLHQSQWSRLPRAAVTGGSPLPKGRTIIPLGLWDFMLIRCLQLWPASEDHSPDSGGVTASTRPA